MKFLFYLVGLVLFCAAISCSTRKNKAAQTTRKIIETKDAIDENMKLLEQNNYERPDRIGSPHGWSFKDTIK